MAYKSIHETFWTDPELKKELKPLDRYLFSYFITCPTSHFSGLYYLPKPTIVDETGMNKKELDRGMDTLIDRGLIRYDEQKDIVLVIKMLKFQVKNANPNDKQKAGIINHFHKLHNTLLINDFIKQWPHLGLKFDIPNDTPIDGVSKKHVIKTVTRTVTETITRKIYTIYFTSRWNKYPLKDSKAEALRHWLANVKNYKDLIDFDKALDNYLGHLKNNSWKPPKSGKTFFNNWRDWVDFVEPKQSRGEKEVRTAEEVIAAENKLRKELDMEPV